MSSSVHRITVREMNEIKCRRQLAVMNRLFKQWQKLSQQGNYNEKRISQLNTIYTKIERDALEIAKQTSRHLVQLNKDVKEFTVVLMEEMRDVREKRLDQQALKSRTEIYRQRNYIELIALLRQQLPTETDLISALEQASSLSVEQMNLLVFRALSVLEINSTQPTDVEKQLLSELKAQSEEVKQFWHSGAPQSPFSLQCEQIALMIEKLKQIGTTQEVQSSEQQLNLIQAMEQSSKRHLRADSLLLTMASQLRESQQKIELVDRIEQLIDELAIFENADRTVIEDALKLMNSGTLIQYTQMIEKLEVIIEQAEQKIIAQAQRKTVLDGLSQLGYQVNDNAVKSWLDDGKVVVTHPSTPGYGLELGGTQTRFQTRTVAFSADRDINRDKDVDAIWCGQHQQLQEIISTSDGELVVERALAAGSGEMKVYENQNEQNQSHNKVLYNRPRTMSK